MSSPSLSLPPADGGDYPPLSALNALAFCPRRCFLQQVEGLWLDNAHTAAGTLLHRRVHAARDSVPDAGPRTVRALPLVSHRLRIVGVADVVEFLPRPDGPEVPYPVEYKRGRRRKWDNDDLQLCAQALCLEEMLGLTVPAGAVFHLKSKRRREVQFTAGLRACTEDAVRRLHELLRTRTAPPAVRHRKCQDCSLNRLCLPDLLNAPDDYLRAARDLFRTE